MNKEKILFVENNYIPKIIILLDKIKYSKIINDIKVKTNFIVQNINTLNISDFDYVLHFKILYNFLESYNLLYKTIDNKCIDVIKEYFSIYWNKLSLA